MFNQTIPQQLITLMDLISSQYKDFDVSRIISGMKEQRKTTLRVNTIKGNKASLIQAFHENNIGYQTVSWYDQAFIVACDERKIQSLDLYEKGYLYMQNLSSMLPPIIMQPQGNTDILDMAAAPGGKTSLIAALTHQKAHITACEASLIRAEKLKFNMERQGVKQIAILMQDARKLDDFFSFDHVLLDAPCSGSGTIVWDDPKTYQSFSMRLVEKSVEIQIELLRKAIKLLKPGKEVIYSTCSILRQENEEVIKSVLQSKNVELIPIEPIEGLPYLTSALEGTLLIAPNELYEGFFIAKLRKK